MANSPLIEPNIKNLMIARMLQQGMDTSPVQHWTQGAARMANALVGGLELGREQYDARSAPGEIMKILQGQQQPSTPMQQPTPSVAPAPGSPNSRIASAFSAMEPQQQNPYAGAISKIESGGNYNAMGPVTRTGDRAHGKYQVMGNNIGPWSEAALGRRVTPQEFLANPEIQDQVFNHRFGQYVNQYGPEGASRAWFAGEGGMNDPNRRDQLGTTVAQYGQRFAQAAGLPQGGQPQSAPQQGIDPRMGVIQQMLNHPNKGVRDMGAQMLQQQLMKQPEDKVVGDNLVRILPNGQTQVLHDATKATDKERNLAAENRARAQRGQPPLSMTEFEQATKAADTRGTQQGEAQINLPTTLAKAQQALETIQKIREHPGKQYGTGALGALPGIPGTAQRGFVQLVNQARGQTFLEAYQTLKGGGAITEVEGAKAEQAIARLDRAQRPEDFEAALKDLEGVIRSGMTRAQLKAEGQSRASAGTTVNNDPLGLR